MNFIEALVLDDGRTLGEALTPWQREMLTGVLSHPYAYLELPRGSGKTTLGAALALTWLLLGRPGGRWYAAAADRDQGGILHDLLTGFVARSPALQAAVRMERWRVLVPSTGSRLEVLSADAGSNLGLLPDGIFCDELAAWPDPELWYALWTSAGKRRARVLVLSTPGVVGHFAQQVRDLAAEGGGRWFYYHRGQPAEWTPADYIEEMRRTLPPEVYARFFEARWVQGGGRPLTPEDAASVFDPGLRQLAAGDRNTQYACGIDLGLVHDRTAIAVLHLDATGAVVVDRLEAWEGSPDNRVLFADLAEALRRIHRDFNHPTIIIDPWQALNLVETLRAEGLRFEEAKFTSEYRHRIDSNLFRLIKDRQLRCFAGTWEAELLRDEMLHLEIELKGGAWRFNHRPGQHDDLWVAVGMAALWLVENARGARPLSPDELRAAEILRSACVYTPPWTADTPFATDDYGFPGVTGIRRVPADSLEFIRHLPAGTVTTYMGQTVRVLPDHSLEVISDGDAEAA